MATKLTNPDRERLLRLAGSYRRSRNTIVRRPITTVDRTGPIPVSFAQERLWFMAQMESMSSAYHVLVRLHLVGDLHVTALRRALDRIVQRHETLRTTFRMVEGRPVQQILPGHEAKFQLLEHELRGPGFPRQWDDADGFQKNELEKLILQEEKSAFDLHLGPLIRGRLIRLVDGEHILLITAHHIITDGWSMGVLWRELSVLYESFQAGVEPPLPELTVQYADYALWQREYLQKEVLERELEYWRKQLAGAPALLELPTDHIRPAVQTFRGATVQKRLSVELLEQLQAIGRRHGATLFMVLLGAVQVLLSKYSGSEDVVLGSPIAGRTRREIEDLIGFFVNRLVLRTNLSGDPTFTELLGRVRETAIGAYEHQELPFDKLVADLQPERSLSYSPIFQVVFQLEEAKEAGAKLTGLRVNRLGTNFETTRSDLMFSFSVRPEGLPLVLTYSTDLFERKTIERMAGHLERVLEQIARYPDVRLADLQLMSLEEQHQLLEEWSGTEAGYPRTRCLQELFEEQVKKTPDAVALVHDGAALSYGEVNRRANQLAHHLRKLGVKPDKRVAICLERSPEMIVSLLAVLKAGGAYVPLDPTYPEERLRFMVEDSEPTAILTQTDVSAVWAEARSAIAVIDLTEKDAAWRQGEKSDPEPPAAGLRPEHLAYVIYTSGSTGRPKGVMVEHRQIVNYALAISDRLGLRPSLSFGFVSTIAADLGNTVLFPALFSGGTLHILTKAETADPHEFARCCRENRIDYLKITPSHFQALLGNEGNTRDIPSGCLIFGGEALTNELATTVHSIHSSCRTFNHYGPAECTVGVLSGEVSERSFGKSVSLGKPLNNTNVYILAGERQPVPVGVSGELYIGGAGVSRGYLNRPRLTAERFEPDPFGGAGGRLYRTGDLGRWQEDGNIEFLGRNDFQVKIRGFRIELGEIEARLSEQEGVREAVVLAREDTPGDKRLVAYYTASDAGTGAEQLRAHLSGKLPEYMVPAAYVRLESLPLTRNGKLDRKALPAPEADAFAVPGYAAPQTETEQVLAGIFAELLKRERVGRQDNFFELGGHSLLVVMLIERMRRGGLQADVRAVFERPTVAGLAASLTRQEGAIEIPANGIPAGCSRLRPAMLPLVQLTQEEIDRLVSSVPGGAGNVQDIYPLSPLQEGILFHHMMGGEGDPYLLAIRMRFAERTRLDAYLGALQGVIDRHDMLRTAVQWEGVSEPVQVVWRKATLVLEEVKPEAGVEDVSGWLAERYDPRRVRIDLGQAPMLRAYIAQDGQTGGWLLTLLRHHLTGDHTTQEVLQEEIEAHLLGQAERLPEPLPFRNLVGQARLGMSREEHEAFFRKLLGDVEEPTAPFGLMNVHGDGTGIKQARMRVDAEVARRIRERARVLGVSAATVCHLAWAQVMGRVAGREDVVFGTIVFGRMQGGAGSDRAMGVFINTLPLRVRLAGYTAEAAAKQVHAQLGELLQHEHCPLSLAQRCSGVAAPMPLFSALLNYRHSPDMAQSRSEDSKRLWEGISVLHAEERTNYPLTLSVDDRGTGFGLTAQVDESIGARRVCELMHRALESLTEALEKEPGRLLEQLDVLPEAERRQVLYEWNDTAAEYPRGRCLQELFEEQVEKTPEAVAVVHAEAAVSYGELNRCANRLAHHLRNLGVKLEDRVAICLERSPEMIVSLLAVLKAGAAYVPLDPAYPEERLRYMLQDSRPVAVLTQPHLQGLFAGLTRTIAVVDVTETAAISAQSEANPESAGLTAEHLAYVIYTSGSTGMPKGVMVPHRAIGRLVLNNRYATFDADSKVAFASNPAFDAATLEIWAPLLNGGRMVVVEPWQVLDPAEFERALVRQSVDTLWLTVGLFNEYAEDLSRALSGLRYLIVGGDALDPGVMRRLLRGSHRPQALLNGYGPTETTTFAATYEIASVAANALSIPIGRPIGNTQVYVLDSRQEPVPAGVSGDLYIGGAGVSRGYLNGARLTAERFVPDPFGGEGGRLYRTGDLGRWQEDGNIEFLGRSDCQVKIRGFRVELGEIEARLSEHEGVREAVVLAREDTPGDKRLVAYYTASDAGTGAEQLRAHLSEKLPDYMMPGAYVRLASLPLTRNGKLDRQALPAPELGGGAVDSRPCSDIEKQIAGMWKNVLGLPDVGVNDLFFDLGGNSLLLYRLYSQVRSLRTDLRLVDLFRYTSVAAQAAYVSDTAVPAPVQLAGARERASHRRAATTTR